MSVDLDFDDIDTLLESLNYSKQRVRDAQGTPYELVQKKLAALDAAEGKLRSARRAKK